MFCVGGSSRFGVTNRPGATESNQPGPDHQGEAETAGPGVDKARLSPYKRERVRVAGADSRRP